MIDLGGWLDPAFVAAFDTQWMGAEEGKAQALPLAIIATLGGAVPLSIVVLLMLTLG